MSANEISTQTNAYGIDQITKENVVDVVDNGLTRRCSADPVGEESGVGSRWRFVLEQGILRAFDDEGKYFVVLVPIHE